MTLSAFNPRPRGVQSSTQVQYTSKGKDICILTAQHLDQVQGRGEHSRCSLPKASLTFLQLHYMAQRYSEDE